jgi:hypothetical protein
MFKHPPAGGCSVMKVKAWVLDGRHHRGMIAMSGQLRHLSEERDCASDDEFGANSLAVTDSR